MTLSTARRPTALALLILATGAAPLAAQSVDSLRPPVLPDEARLFFGPTARTPAAGAAFVGTWELYFPLVGVAVTDHVMIAAGAPVLGSMASSGVFYVAPKVRMPGTPEGFDLAMGGLYLLSGDDVEGVTYVVTTLGSRDRALTLGAILPTYIHDSEPFALVGFESRLGPRAKVVSENYVGVDAVLLSVGSRLVDGRLAVDLGVGAGFEYGERPHFIPIIDFVYSF